MTTFNNALQDVWLNDPVLGAIITRMNVRKDKSIPLMVTNGRELLINESEVAKLTRNEMALVLAHEALHVARAHHLRSDGRGGKPEWQIATDCAINTELWQWAAYEYAETSGTTAGNQDLPIGLSAEEYYNLIKQKEKEKEASPQSGGNDPSPNGTPDNSKPKFSGAVLPCPEPDLATAQAEYQQQMMEAILLGEQAGRLPGWAQKMKANLTVKPKLNWKVLLRQWMMNKAKLRRSFERPSRRQAVQGSNLILPGKSGRTLGKMLFMVDVSGSMSRYQDKLDLALAEIKSVLQLFPNAEVRVIQWNVGVVSDTVIHNVKEWFWEAGSGTSIRPALKRAKEHRPDVVVIWTDGWIADIPDKVLMPTLWCITSECRTLARENCKITSKLGTVIYV